MRWCHELSKARAAYALTGAAMFVMFLNCACSGAQEQQHTWSGVAEKYWLIIMPCLTSQRLLLFQKRIGPTFCRRHADVCEAGKADACIKPTLVCLPS